jgi:glycosyltransferase involved in cell wall biosynthesis
MRIGITTSVIQRGRTGIAQYLFALLRGLMRHGGQHEYTLFVLEEDLGLFNFIDGTMRVVAVPERFRPPVKNILWHQQSLPRLARTMGLQVLHVPSYRRLLWAEPCAKVATIHDLAPFHVANKYDWKRMLYGRMVVRRLAKRQQEVIAISENTARDILRFFSVPRPRITVIHNGIEHERFFPGSPAAAKASAAEKYDLRQPFFLYIARLEHPGKNHVRLIAAFNTFKEQTKSDWQLVLGGSDWHGAEQIHENIRASHFAKDIRCLGFVPDESLPDLYRAAEAFVFPSLYEGFGMPPSEAMACGCPVISSTRGSLGEVVGQAAALVEPEDVSSMVKQLTAVATEPALRDLLRAAGLKQARKFDWNRTAKQTLSVYEKAAAKISSAAVR